MLAYRAVANSLPLALAAGLLIVASFPLSAASQARSWAGRGEVRAIHVERDTVVLRHEAIPGLMRAMTMPFRVRDRRVLSALRVGQGVTFRLERRAEGGFVITEIRAVDDGSGQADGSKGRPSSITSRSRSSRAGPRARPIEDIAASRISARAGS